MRSFHRELRTYFPIAACVAFLALPHHAFAQPALTTAQCAAFHESAQRSQRVNRYLSAIEAFEKCANPQCPAPIRIDCEQWLEKAKLDLPSLKIRVVDSKAQPVRLRRVVLDGSAAEDLLRGDLRQLDPGEHTLRIESETGATLSTEFILKAASGTRELSLEISESPPVAVPAPTRVAAPVLPEPAANNPTQPAREGSPVYAYGTAALGIIGLATFGYFAVSGRSKQTEMERDCAPYCASERVDAMHRDFVVADIGLAVGIISSGVSAYLFLTSTKSVAVSAGPTWTGFSGHF